jgi:hypothetical protein
MHATFWLGNLKEGGPLKDYTECNGVVICKDVKWIEKLLRIRSNRQTFMVTVRNATVS